MDEKDGMDEMDAHTHLLKKVLPSLHFSRLDNQLPELLANNWRRTDNRQTFGRKELPEQLTRPVKAG